MSWISIILYVVGAFFVLYLLYIVLAICLIVMGLNSKYGHEKEFYNKKDKKPETDITPNRGQG